MLTIIVNKNAQYINCHLGNWIKHNLVTVTFNDKDDQLWWINKENDILIWQSDEQYNGKGICLYDINCNYKITMNTVFPNTIPSFYWSRDENQLMKFIEQNKYRSYNERPITSIFLGSIQDSYQGSFRTTYDWKEYIDEFYLSKGGINSHKYNQQEYYEMLSKSKFGLTLRGGGPKCWRDIEYLALGTVLIVTDGVDVNNYHNPLVENIHYIKCVDPKNLQLSISKISEKQWENMSKECIKWYEKNCRYDGSIKILEEIVSKLN